MELGGNLIKRIKCILGATNSDVVPVIQSVVKRALMNVVYEGYSKDEVDLRVVLFSKPLRVRSLLEFNLLSTQYTVVFVS